MLPNRHFRDQFYFEVESKTAKAVKKSCGDAIFDEVWFLMRRYNNMADLLGYQTYFEEE
jgi:hypothetical protein